MRIIISLMRLLLGLAFTVLLLGLVTFLLIILIDWNRHRGLIAGAIDRYTDYQVVRLDFLKLDIGRTSELHLGDISIRAQTSNATISEFTAKEFTLKIELLPLLFKDQLRLKTFNLTKARIIISPQEKASAEKAPDFPTPIIKSAHITDTTVVVHNRKKNEKPLTLVVQKFTASAPTADQSVAIDGEGLIASLPFKLKGELGPFQQFKDGKKPYPVVITGSVLNDNFSLKADIGSDADNQTFRLDFYASGNQLQELAGAMNFKLGAVPAYIIEVSTKGSMNKLIASDLKMTLGQTYIYGDAALRLDRKRPYIKADIAASLIRLADLRGFIPPRVDRPHTGPLFSDAPLPFELLNLVDADLSIMVGEFSGAYPGKVISEFRLTIKLDNGLLVIDPISIGLAGGTMGGSIVLNHQEDPLAANFNLGLKEVDLSILIAPFVQDLEIVDLEPQQVLAGHIAGNIELKTHGISPRALASHLGGSLSFAIEDGALSATIVEASGISVPKAILSWIREHPTTALDCLVAAFTAQAGIIDTQVMLIVTPNYNITGGGAINLREETIDYTIQSDAKKIRIGSTQSPIHIKGPLRDLEIEILTPELLARLGTAAIAAFFNPALALLPLVDLGLAEDGHCAKHVSTMKKIEDKGEEKIAE